MVPTVVLRQSAAFIHLQWRQWTRGAVLVGRAAQRGPRAHLRAGLLVLFLWSGAISLWAKAATVVDHDNRLAMTHWLLIGALMMGLALTFSQEVPGPRNAFSLMHEPLMETLPIPPLHGPSPRPRPASAPSTSSS